MRIVLIGAGSVVFTRRLLSDFLTYPELRDAQIVLHDIDPTRLKTAERLARQLREVAGGRGGVEAHLDRRAALAGADFVVNTIQVGGDTASRVDFEIPSRYGLRYTINDTIGTGGVMRSLRTIPVVLGIAADMEALCPDAWLLNHTNPLATVMRAIDRCSDVTAIGLCHSVVSTIEAIARYLALPAEEVEHVAAGVNHLAFMLRLQHRGQDLYPRLRAFAEGEDLPQDDLVRLELLRRLGYYPTESSEHHAEYSPWFIPKDGLVERFGIPIGEYLSRLDDGLADYQDTVRRLDAGDDFEIERSGEYTAAIVNARSGGEPTRIVVNVMNDAGLIDDIPADACVEVPGDIDAAGIHPCAVGPLPAQCRAYIGSALDMQALTVQAALDEDREAVYHAIMTDPLVEASLDLDQAWRMTDDLIAAEQEWLPGWLTTGRA